MFTAANRSWNGRREAGYIATVADPLERRRNHRFRPAPGPLVERLFRTESREALLGQQQRLVDLAIIGRRPEDIARPRGAPRARAGGRSGLPVGRYSTR